MAHPWREFAPGAFDAARSFMTELEPEYERVCIEESIGSDSWRFVFGDHITHVREHLDRVASGRRFRVRALPRVESRPGH